MLLNPLGRTLRAVGWRFLVLMTFFPLPAFLVIALVSKIVGTHTPLYVAGALALGMIGFLLATAAYAGWRTLRDKDYLA